MIHYPSIVNEVRLLRRLVQYVLVLFRLRKSGYIV